MSNASSPATGPPLDLSKLPHDNQQANIIAAGIITWLIGAAFVAARFYTKAIISRQKLGGSEWCVLISTLFSLATTVCLIIEVEFGLGAHIWDLGPTGFNMVAATETQWVSIIFYIASLTFAKISILLLYLMIFNHTWVKPACYFVLSLTALSSVWITYVIATACIPLQGFWDPSVKAVCHPQSYWLSNQGLTIFTDFLTFILPIPVILKLNVKPRQKGVLLFLFTLGFFVCMISIVRIIIVQPVLENAGTDPTYASTPVFYWTEVELNLAIVVACAVTLKPLITRVTPRLLSSHPYKEHSSDSSGSTLKPLRTYGSGRPPVDSIRVDQSFTAEYGTKNDVEMNSPISPAEAQIKSIT